MMQIDNAFLADLEDDLRNQRLELPVLPDVAVKVGELVRDPGVGVSDLAHYLSTEPVLAGRLIQMANSAFFQDLVPVSNVRAAVNRLGMVCVRNLTMSLVLGQMYKRKSVQAIKDRLAEVWRHATRVAAYSQVIAAQRTQIKADEALLAGLVHNAGMLPLLARVSNEAPWREARVEDFGALEAVQLRVGTVLLEIWGLPGDIVAAVGEHETLYRTHDGPADLTDVIMVANLHCRLGTAHRLGRVNWSDIPAFSYLGLTPAASIAAMRDARAEIEATERMLAA